jgi:hypothetical protein
VHPARLVPRQRGRALAGVADGGRLGDAVPGRGRQRHRSDTGTDADRETDADEDTARTTPTRTTPARPPRGHPWRPRSDDHESKYGDDSDHDSDHDSDERSSDHDDR